MATYTGTDKAIAFLFDIAASIAADYNSASTYAADDYVIYSGTLYKCISAISTPEEFTPAHWQTVLVMDEVAAGGGGGGGTTVIANPAGTATETLNKLQVGSTIYDVPSGGGSSGHIYSTSEHAVGVWTDGKTVYERTIQSTYTGVLSASNIINISSWGIDTMISINGTFSYDANNKLATGYISFRWDATYIKATTSYTTQSRTWSFTVTVQYTKT